MPERVWAICNGCQYYVAINMKKRTQKSSRFAWTILYVTLSPLRVTVLSPTVLTTTRPLAINTFRSEPLSVFS
jgi:hypothetical protein